MFVKNGMNGIWDIEQHEKVVRLVEELGMNDIANTLAEIEPNNPNARPLHHRRMSNNSVAFESRPSEKELSLIFEMMKAEGEPGFVNLEEAERRRPNAEGLNPCVEIILDSYGVCNLTTVNLVQFVEKNAKGEYFLNTDELARAQKASARAGLRMTLTHLELRSEEHTY